MIKAWSLQKWSLQLFAISIIVRIYIYMHVYLLFAHAGNEIDTIQWQNLNKIKMIYELNLKIHDETKSTITFRVYFLYHSGQ